MPAKESYKQRLKHITTFVFDVDGVFTDNKVLVTPDGQLLRSMNSRDGYAIQLAAKRGYRLCVITGGRSEAVRQVLMNLGIQHVFLGSSNKLSVFDNYCREENISPEEVLYMGDDIPDLPVMHKVGVAVCPADAANDVLAYCHHVSPVNGGHGCVREIIEQVLKLQQNWLREDAYEW